MQGAPLIYCSLVFVCAYRYAPSDYADPSKILKLYSTVPGIVYSFRETKKTK